MLKMHILVVLVAFFVTLHSILAENEHTLFAAYDDVLSKDFMDKVAAEARHANEWTLKEDSFQFGKRPTFWLQTVDPIPKPRNHIEEAVLRLSKYALPDMYSQRAGEKIIGGEWWVQVRHGTETIGFHYDKDEAMASEQMRMKHPLISTVTYLTDLGAPTLIFNQTTNGNDETPEIPEIGYISYPKFNRHITFSGDLQHGVLGSASKSGRVQLGRVTLLINWWEVAPLEPNTKVLSDEDLKDMDLYINPDTHIHDANKRGEMNVCYDEDKDYSDILKSRLDVPISPTPSVENGGKRHTIEIPPGDQIYANLPKDMNSGVHALHWAWDEIYGSLGMLDLNNRNQVSTLFRLEEPKLIFIYDPRGIEGKKLQEDMLKAILPIGKTYVKSLKVYFAPITKCKDILAPFRLDESDAPRLVIDDTVNGNKFAQTREEFSKDPEVILAWIKKHVNLEGLENKYK
jgi:hypothetical protein